MKAMSGVAKNRHGVYYVRLRVPKGLQEAVAQHLNNDKPRQVFLKRTLGTKDLREANIRAKPVLMDHCSGRKHRGRTPSADVPAKARGRADRSILLCLPA
jgi:hypothetical protein